MPMNEDYDYEDDNLENEHEVEDQEPNPLAAQLASLQEQIAQMNAQLRSKDEPKKETQVELSDEQMEAIAKNPKLLGQFVKAQINQTTTQIQRESQKAQFDKAAEERFPMLRSNKDFQRQVFEKMREMVEVTKEFSWESPTLMLRAAEIVAPRASGVLEVNKRNRQDGQHEALDTSNGTHRSRTAKAKINEQDPRLTFAKLFGIDQDPKKLEAFKAQLGPYEAPARKRGRSLMK